MDVYQDLAQKRWGRVSELVYSKGINNHVERPLQYFSEPLLHHVVSLDAPLDIIAWLISPLNINLQDKDGDTALHKAVYHSRWRQVPILIHHGANVDVCNKQGRTSLHLSVLKKASKHTTKAPKEIFNLLISPMNLNTRDEDGSTVLHDAVRKGRWHEVRILLQHNADVNTVDRQLRTALHFAVRLNTPKDIITQLISRTNINVQDKNGDTVLHVATHVAVMIESWHEVNILVQHNADVNRVNRQLKTALHCSARINTPEHILTQLITPMNINMQDKDGNTMLHDAVRKKRWHEVKILVKYNADVNRVNKLLRTALHCACDEKTIPVDIITQLVSTQNINLRDTSGSTALSIALGSSKSGIPVLGSNSTYRLEFQSVPFLIEYGADINLQDKYLRNPLHHAVINDAPEEITIKVIYPPNINRQDKDGNTALHKAAIEKRWHKIAFLIQHGSDVNIGNSRMHAPLFYAIMKGAPIDIISHLVSSQNINMQDVDNDTVLHEAVNQHEWELVPVLVEHGSDINITNSDKQTPLHCAIHEKAPSDVVLQLISQKNINMEDVIGSTALQTAVNKRLNETVCILIQHDANPKVIGIQSDETVLDSLKGLCIHTIRHHMSVKTDEAFEQLGLPRTLLPDVKLRPLAEQINQMNISLSDDSCSESYSENSDDEQYYEF